MGLRDAAEGLTEREDELVRELLVVAFRECPLVQELAEAFLTRYQELLAGGGEVENDAQLRELHSQLWMAVKAHQHGAVLHREDFQNGKH